jgi:hypothetical protein
MQFVDTVPLTQFTDDSLRIQQHTIHAKAKFKGVLVAPTSHSTPRVIYESPNADGPLLSRVFHILRGGDPIPANTAYIGSFFYSSHFYHLYVLKISSQKSSKIKTP